MSKQLTRTNVTPRRRWTFEMGNTIGFPTALRDAIPDLPTSVGRVLKLDSINADATDSQLFGPRVHLKLLAKETGKLTGEFTVRIDLDPKAALALAETLTKLAAKT
jgi:hypothetical protein